MAYTTIDDPAVYFTTVLWTGNATGRSITTGMDADMVWYKGRSYISNHSIVDSVRGTTKVIMPNNEDAEATDSGSITAFNSTNFTIGTAGGINGNTNTYVAWCWKEAAAAGFDIVSYSGNATSGRTQAHSLSAKPNLMIAKKTSASGGAWFVYLTGAVPATNYMKLNESQTTQLSSSIWNNTEPTSSVFSLGSSSDVNGSGITYVSYLFAEKQGFSKFGKYVGNGNADGTFVYTGFKPAFVLTKGNVADGWAVWDNKRVGYNVDNNYVQTHSGGAEETTDDIDFLSNGFKFRGTNGLYNGTSASFYLYAAFAEAPFVNSNGVPCNAR
jgi:hypothetical protein